ncbi:sulfite exporter TauE/SafE family protein [Mesoplasma chauliocola]|uniref:Probable membrane transporter protein n=1 Tax=Mesoplasma chauliocola TaxID=216427 RepID=A0A249SP34_9MOLU|nr:sulfite exporter TauE/SafE family protein [Mesoplasma chauliocola]ASZ09387.1 sulfite exporter TauE/SafE family protein [Mesoplasma chauliocola]
MIFLLFFAVATISILGSLSGVGGGVLFIPLFMLVLKDQSNENIKFLSTWLVLIGALINVLIELARKSVNPLVILVGCCFSLPAIFLGNFINSKMDQIVSQIIIVIFLSIVCIVLISQDLFLKNKKSFECNKNNRSKFKIRINNFNDKRINWIFLGMISFIGGIITSLTGMGGGPILMPALILIFSLSMKEAAPISHSLIMVSSTFSIATNYEKFKDSEFAMKYILPLSFAVGIAMFISFFAKKIIKNERYIKWLLIILMIFSIMKMLFDILS